MAGSTSFTSSVMRSSSAWLFSMPATSMRAAPWAMEFDEVTTQLPPLFSKRSNTPRAISVAPK